MKLKRKYSLLPVSRHALNGKVKNLHIIIAWFYFSVITPCIHLTIQLKINGIYRLKNLSNLSDRLERCFCVVKRRSCDYLSAL